MNKAQGIVTHVVENEIAADRMKKTVGNVSRKGNKRKKNNISMLMASTTEENGLRSVTVE